jgi:hypothetical protein
MILRDALAEAREHHERVGDWETEERLMRLVTYALTHGASFRQIARAAGWSSPSTAHKYARRAPRPNRAAVLDQELPKGWRT